MSETRDAREVLARVYREHRTDRAWSFGWGEDFGAPPDTAGADCRCGQRFVRYDRDSDPEEVWIQHWAAASLAALSDAGLVVVPREPTDAMVDAGVDAASTASEGGDDEGESRGEWLAFYERIMPVTLRAALAAGERTA